MVAPPAGITPFVGRSAEMARLVALFDEAAAGRGGVALLAGEPGIGKTRLADELATVARARGVLDIRGRCPEIEGAPPLWSWLQVLRALLRDLTADELRAALGHGAAVVSEALPELRDRLPGIEEPPPLEPALARFRLLAAIAGFLHDVARRRGSLLLILDDLHWADALSLALFQFIAAEAGEAPLLVVGTYRDDAVDAGHPLAPVVAEVARRPRALHLALRGLDVEAVGHLAASACSVQPAPALVQALAGDTAGNPLFVLESVRLLEAEGRLVGTGGADLWRGGVPLVVRDVIARRLAHLPPACREVLAVAAVLGRDFDAASVAAAEPRMNDAVLGALYEAELVRIIEAVPAVDERFRFAHALLRQVLYAEIPRPRRSLLHRQVGEALERHGGGDSSHAGELAHHFLQAGGADAAAKALAHARAGAAQARSAHAYEAAARLDALALQALDGAAPADAASRCALLLDLGEDLHRAGEDSERTGEAFQQAAALARTLLEGAGPVASVHGAGGAPLLARAALGMFDCAPLFGGREQHVVPLLEEALRALGDEDSAARALVLARLGQELHPTGGGERAITCTRDAVAVARRLGDAGTLVACLVACVATAAMPLDFPERQAAIAELLRLGEARRDIETTLRALRWQVVDRLENGDVVAADEAIGRFAQLAAELRHPLYRWQVSMLRSVRALLAGDLAEGERLMSEAAATRGPARDPDLRRFLGAARFYLRREQGLGGTMLAASQQAAQSFPRVPVYAAGLAILYADLGRETEARALYERVLERDFAGFPSAAGWLSTCAFLAELAGAFGDGRGAALLYEQLAPHAGLVVIAGTPSCCLGAVAHYLGLLAATIARTAVSDAVVARPGGSAHWWAVAARHFEEALACHARMGAAGLLAHTRYEYARLLLDHARTHRAGFGVAPPWAGADPASRARTLLDEALTAARALGMVRLVGLVDAALAALPAPAPARPPPPAAHPEGLTARELEVLRLLARGATNKEIAAALYVSPNTVRQHTIAIYRKLDVRSRTEAATWAARQGLLAD